MRLSFGSNRLVDPAVTTLLLSLPSLLAESEIGSLKALNSTFRVAISGTEPVFVSGVAVLVFDKFAFVFVFATGVGSGDSFR